ncbi:hypothetical protein JT05_09425 [Desulfosporosinus sp. Tol-M]|nr:hypothetical protein JT05_09425 [Desulfosporosinus sp. Tol-M]
MRLFVDYIRSRVKNLKWVSKAVGNAHNNLIEISGYLPMIEVINDLEEFDFLYPEIKFLKEITQMFDSKTSTVIIGRDTFNLCESHLKRVHLKCKAVIEAIDQVMPEQKMNSISVKLPQLRLEFDSKNAKPEAADFQYPQSKRDSGFLIS